MRELAIWKRVSELLTKQEDELRWPCVFAMMDDVARLGLGI